jgi:hypothetical protein
MANKIFYDAQAVNPEVKILAGSFLPNGSSAIVNASNTGAGFTVAYTGTGIYTITLTDSYPGLLSATATLALNAVADAKVQLGAIDVTTAKTIVINNITGTSAADIASNANNRIHFCLILRNTSLLK